jgi:hypothetical protein
MDWQLISHYILGIVTLPVSIYTVKCVVENFGTLFDEDLTIKDRNLLKQFAFFVLLPMVVLFHEIGHALAARYFGATVTAFHWSIFWGEVVIDGKLTPFQHYVIALAGNLFQLATCFFALGLALIETSPALVALSVYFYIFNGLACLIGYPLLSLTAWNDDFAMIYGQPNLQIATITGIVHLLLIALFLFTFFSTTWPSLVRQKDQASLVQRIFKSTSTGAARERRYQLSLSSLAVLLCRSRSPL